MKTQNQTSTKGDSKRIYGLDILRASAILLVMVLHSKNYMPQLGKNIIDNFVFDGVSLFFVLSGFLIGGILIKLMDKNPINKQVLFHFWIRRWFRTLPNYFLILLILCILSGIYSPNFSVSAVAKYFIFSQNLMWIHPSFFPESWSLSVEEWFYLLVPLLILIMVKIFHLSFRNSLITIALLLILCVTIFRFSRYVTMDFTTVEMWDKHLRQQVFTRLDSLMYGVIGAYLNFFHKSIWVKYKHICLLGGVLLLIVNQILVSFITPINGVYTTVFSFTLFAIGVLAMLPYLNELKVGKGMLYRVVTRISLISYSMYLVHLTLIQEWVVGKIPFDLIMGNTANIIPLSKLVMYWILTIVVSEIFYRLYEIPTTKMRDNIKLHTYLRILPESTKKHE